MSPYISLADELCHSEHQRQQLNSWQNNYPSRPQRWLILLFQEDNALQSQWYHWLKTHHYGSPQTLPHYQGPLPGQLQLHHLLDYQVVVTGYYAGVLQLGVLDPTDPNIINEFQTLSQQEVELQLIDPTTLRQQLDELTQQPLMVAEPLAETQFSLADQLCSLIGRAWQEGISDLHFEPTEDEFRIRARIDGLLQPYMSYPKHLCANIISWLKVNAELDIAQKRLPQDGRLKLPKGAAQQVDIRISTLPTIQGEKIALRLLSSSQQAPSLEQLGLSGSQLQRLMTALQQPQGLIIVTGPTGSGKTTTLYAALSQLNDPAVNISTAEDPVEIQLPGINQVAVNPAAGLTFAKLLRAFLRQDPDIIMVGEIRDQETAVMAFRAAQTGHRVLTTLHTNNAIETITRLAQLGIPRYQISESTQLIIAQRLLRKRCPVCHGSGLSTDPPNPCPFCHQGYQGRIGIYEILPITSELAPLIESQAPLRQWQPVLAQLEFQPLGQRATALVKESVTTLSEAQRVLGHLFNE